MVDNISQNPVLIVGCGLSGLTVALEVAKYKKVKLLTKGDPIISATAWAQGGIVHLTKDEESIKTHVQDTIKAGDGLVDQEVLEFIARSGYQTTEWLINHGVVFSKDKKLNQDFYLIVEIIG